MNHSAIQETNRHDPVSESEMQAQAVPVLLYHHVSPAAGAYTVSPLRFERQMRYLAEQGYTTLGGSQFQAWLSGAGSVPARSVVITFDDGYLDNLVYAQPILRHFGHRALLFVVTDWMGGGVARNGIRTARGHDYCLAAIGGRGNRDEVLLRWSELEQMKAAATFEIQSHSHTHRRWDNLEKDWRDVLSLVKEDLALSKERLRERLGLDSTQLCWPWGIFTADYQAIAAAAGFTTQYTVFRGANTTSTSPLHVHRAVVPDQDENWLARHLAIYGNAFTGGLLGSMYGAWRSMKKAVGA